MKPRLDQRGFFCIDIFSFNAFFRVTEAHSGSWSMHKATQIDVNLLPARESACAACLPPLFRNAEEKDE